MTTGLSAGGVPPRSGRRSAPLALTPLAALLLATGSLGAQAVEPAGSASRPRIGIAFSGGGAKGCAHIGVLKVLEELRIPVDFAAGTSMGAILGGLYATGLSPAELEQIIVELDWADALDDRTERSELPFRRKNDDLLYIPDIEIGVSLDGLKYPLGLRSGQKLNYLLTRLTMPARSVRDFDDLPIPFRAVATDIADGRPVVLSSGDLARALRASMAIPTAFTPVEIDGRLLVDGGISNNIPVDVVRAMGADVVIAIDIGSPLLAEEKVNRSYLTILNQTLGLITRANMAPQIAQADLVITPPVGDYGTMAFHRGEEIVDLGEEEARKHAEQLSRFSLSEAEYAAWKASRQREPDAVPVISEVRVEGNSRVDIRSIRPLVRTRAGLPFSPEAARDDLARIFGLGDFESVDLEFEPGPEGTALVYRVREKPWGPNYLRVGLSFEADFEGENALTFLGGLRATRLNALGGEWSTDAQLGERMLFRTELYQPLAFENGWFVAPSAGIGRDQVPLFRDGVRLAELEVQAVYARLDLGYVFGRYGEVRFGIERSAADIERESGEVPEDLVHYLGESIDRGQVHLRGTVDTLDNAKLPKLGWLVQFDGEQSLESLGAEEDFVRLELHVDRFWTTGRHTVFGGLQGGASPEGTLPPYEQFRLGGLFSLTGFAPGELAGESFALARTGYLFRFSGLFHVGLMFEAAEVGESFDELGHDVETAATALIVADTLAGPLYFGFGTAGDGHSAAYVLYGRRF